MFSRRDFLKAASLSTGFLLVNPFCSAFDNKPIDINNLFFDPSDIPELKRRLQLPMFESFWNEMLNADLKEDRRFLETEVEYNNQIRHIARVDKILEREAFVYLMTGDKIRGEMAKLAVQTILKFKKWDYFLEAGKDVLGIQRASLTAKTIVITYGWIKDLLSESEKEDLFAQLGDKGCEPCYRSLHGMLHQDQVVGWGFDPESSFYEERDMRNWPKILSRTNLRAVPISALGIGALFLKERDSRYNRWMDMVEKSYNAFVDLFEPDGSYPEGTGYCRYTSDELILFLEVLQRHTKKDWSKAINWQGVMDFFLMTRMPSSNHPEGHVNFGDGGHGFSSNIGFWIAKKYNDGLSQYAAIHHKQNHKILSVIWYDPKIKEKKPQKKWYYRHFDIGWVIASAGFEPENFVVALRSGPPANHENADRNSLILKCYSENLLVDHWHPPYSHLHKAWALRTSPAHNCVLIDGKGHQYHDGMEGTNASLAEAKVVKEQITDDYAIVSSDATQAYQLVNDNVKNVTRTFLTIPELKFVLIFDSFIAQKNAADFTARWFVDNEDKKGEISINKNQFKFFRPAAELVGICDGSDGISLSKNNFPVPEEHGIYPHLDIIAAKKNKKIDLICAMVAIQKNEDEPILNLKQLGKTWKFDTKLSGKKLSIEINAENLIPEFNVKMS